MSAVPSILSSAQAAFQSGFALQDKAASEIVQGSLADPLNPSDTTSLRQSINAADPLEAGMLDTIRAQTLISSGAALVHAYNRTTDDLFRMLDTSHDHNNPSN